MAINPSDFERGTTILHKEQVWMVMEYSSRKMGRGRGSATVSVKLRNVETGAVLTETFRSTDKVEEVEIDERDMQFLYRNGDHLVMMDNETYEQPEIAAELLGELDGFLKEGENVTVTVYDGRYIGVDLPAFVEIAVEEAPPLIKGDQFSQEQRDITLVTGGKVKAPPFIKAGDVVQIDTRTLEYVKRVEKS